jgi:predicted amidohydrolase
MRLGLIQVPSAQPTTVEEGVDLMISLMEDCFRRGADLAFTPEAWQYAAEPRDKTARVGLMQRHAQRTQDKCSALASKYHAYVGQWEYDMDSEGRLYNAMYLLDRHGERIGTHRKTHLTYAERALEGLDFGDTQEVFDLDVGKVGILICFENYFPEPARIMAAQGAQLLLYPLAGDNKLPSGQWETKFQARAIDNTVYIASEQRELFDPSRRRTAYTGVVNPSGVTITRLFQPGQVAVVDIDLAARKTDLLDGGFVADMRQYLEISRRPQVYQGLTRPNQTTQWTDVILERGADNPPSPESTGPSGA